jgi:hypothetical protein
VRADLEKMAERMIMLWTVTNKKGQFIGCYHAKNAAQAISRVMEDEYQTASVFRKSQPVSIQRSDLVATLQERPEGVTFRLSPAELKLLNKALRAAIGDDGIENLGFTKREQRQLARIANDLTEAAGSGRPFWE